MYASRGPRTTPRPASPPPRYSVEGREDSRVQLDVVRLTQDHLAGEGVHQRYTVIEQDEGIGRRTGSAMGSPSGRWPQPS